MGSFLVDREIEYPSLSLEVLDQLFYAAYDHRGCRIPAATSIRFRLVQVVDEADLADIGICSADPQKTQGGLMIGRDGLQHGIHCSGVLMGVPGTSLAGGASGWATGSADFPSIFHFPVRSH